MNQAEPYIDFAINAFGIHRLGVASDYGITNIKFQDWIGLLFKVFKTKNLNKEQIEKIMSKNVIELFKLKI